MEQELLSFAFSLFIIVVALMAALFGESLWKAAVWTAKLLSIIFMKIVQITAQLMYNIIERWR
jgi:flagellar motor component MotA